MPRTVDVAVFRPLRQIFTYSVPDEIPHIPAGRLLELPFGRGKVRGMALSDSASTGKTHAFKLRPLTRCFAPHYDLSPDLIRLAKWMSQYYFCPLGEVFSAMGCPQPLQSDRLEPGGVSGTRRVSELPELNPGQQEVWQALGEAGDRRPILLHGVTGSGKSLIYWKAFAECLERGESCIYLLPEITLTRETLRAIRGRFDPVLVFHSGMSPKERRETWLNARMGGPHLVIGARSALFSPLQKIGLIVVDEEHDHSYKQDSDPRYHARDVALLRARELGAMAILGSATPALESYANAESGKYRLLKLLRRFSPHPPPVVKLVDMREEARASKTGKRSFFSRQLIEMTHRVIAEKRQVIFFLNRRGFATTLYCGRCDSRLECPHCSVSLTFYKRESQCRCHHCGHSQKEPERCPVCSAAALTLRGAGTERIHEVVEKIFPGYRIVRVDGSTQQRGEIQSQLEKFMTGEGDILVGTQIISKGLDSPRIGLSAALNADLDLGLPDFRAAERDFQQLTQLAGRPGRGDSAGEAVFQTEMPDHYAIRHALAHDYVGFYRQESEFRREYAYPPFMRLARIIVSASGEEALVRAVGRLQKTLTAAAREFGLPTLGPCPAPIQRIKRRFRWHLLVKSASPAQLTRYIDRVLPAFEAERGIDVVLDRDPVQMM